MSTTNSSSEELTLQELNAAVGQARGWAGASELLIRAVTEDPACRSMRVDHAAFEQLRWRTGDISTREEADFSALLEQLARSADLKRGEEYVVLATTGHARFWGHVILRARPRSRCVIVSASRLPAYRFISFLNRRTALGSSNWYRRLLISYVTAVTGWRKTRLRLRGYRIVTRGNRTGLPAREQERANGTD